MKFIDTQNINRLGKLTAAACKIAEQNGLGVLKCCHGGQISYRIIKENGLGAYEDFLSSLEEVDDFLKHLDEHKNTYLWRK